MWAVRHGAPLQHRSLPLTESGTCGVLQRFRWEVIEQEKHNAVNTGRGKGKHGEEHEKNGKDMKASKIAVIRYQLPPQREIITVICCEVFQSASVFQCAPARTEMGK